MSLRFKRRASTETPEAKHMYASERLMNFRFIAKCFATHAARPLTPAELVDPALEQALGEVGQFAEVSYAAALSRVLRLEFVFQNLPMLLQPDWPLEGYDALAELQLVASFRGRTGDVPGYVAYRAKSKELVLGIAGTSSLTQAWYDVRALMHPHRAGKGCKVHTGFWKLHKGLRALEVDALKQGLAAHDVQRVILTGHSLGGALSYLLAVDILRDPDILPAGIPVTVAVFGAPRCGNSKLVDWWEKAVGTYRQTYGDEAFQEYSVKAFNDGVPAIPPTNMGYRHFAKRPLYFVYGRLYRIPEADHEHALFAVQDADEARRMTAYPRGGHNYYGGRDLERFERRMAWLEELKTGGDPKWAERYVRRVEKRERGWMSKMKDKVQEKEKDISEALH